MKELSLRNRQRVRRVRLRLLRRIVRSALEQDLGIESYDLSLNVVGSRTMSRLHQTHLGHAGPTDVITFDYAEPSPTAARRPLQGEIFICVPVALDQAVRFRSTWQNELTRYALHGLLHLCGYDDKNTSDRIAMKRQEDRLVRLAASRQSLVDLGV